MGLDEFKELYNNSVDLPMIEMHYPNISNTGKSQGALVTLQKNITYALYISSAAIVLYAGVITAAIGIHDFIQNPVNDIMLSILFTEFLVSLINYFTVKKMQNPVGKIKENLLYKLSLLKLRYKWYYILNVGLFLLMPLYVELDLQSHGLYHGLGKINVFIRLAWYIIVFGCLFVIKKEAQKQQFGHYLDQLGQLLKQAE